MNVLSLFDGISCGQVALERAGIKVDNYFASEIDKYAIKVTMKNYPNTIQLGDVTKISYKNGVLYSENGKFNVGKIDLLIGGSPCQGFSFAGKQLNFEDPRSKLFFEYERILKEVNPEYFLLENVKMKKEYKDVISECLNVEPIMINSSLVCAAERKRYYWSNIPNITQPNDLKIILKDIVVDATKVPEKYWYDKEFVYNGDDKKVQCTLNIKGKRLMREVYNLNGKCNTLLCDGNGGNLQQKVYQNGKCRKLMPLEYERLQTLPDNYTDCISDSRRYTALGNGWTVDVIAHIFNFLKQFLNNNRESKDSLVFMR